jgi:integrase
MGEQLSTTETFGEFFDRWLQNRRPYLEAGTHADYEVHGRTRLAPLRPIKLTKLSTQTIETLVAQLAEEGRYAPKTINNALVTLVACLNDAARKGKLVRNPAAGVQRLPARHIERDYLRLHEIPIYLDAFAPAYRPLAEPPIATGMRISEALALSWNDIDLENNAIPVLRSGKRDGDGSTKGDRFRSVDFGPGLATVLAELQASAARGARRRACVLWTGSLGEHATGATHGSGDRDPLVAQARTRRRGAPRHVASQPAPHRRGFEEGPPATVPNGAEGPLPPTGPGFQFRGGTGGRGLASIDH